VGVDMNLKEITTRDILAIMYSLGVFLLLAFRIPVPDQIWSGLILILTFFFMAPKPNTTTTTTEAPNEKFATINTNLTP
jgi:putative effector of murein hydrolase LrgA (UPF0299 family)